MAVPNENARPARDYPAASLHLLESLLANLDGMVYRCLADAAWSMQFVSEGALELTGYRPDELLGAGAVTIAELIHRHDRVHVQQAVQAALASGKRYEIEFRLTRKNGETRWVSARGTPVAPAQGGHWMLEGIIQDISRRKKADADLLEAERRYRSIFENAVEGIYQSTQAQGYLAANPALARIYGYDSPGQLITRLQDIGRQLYVDPGRRLEFMAIMEEHGVVSNFESRVYRQDGSIIWISENARAVRDASGTVLFYEGTVEDITQRKIHEADIHFRATHDPLTRLANRSLLHTRLDQAIAHARHAGKYVATVFLDLDKFKYINDSLGHQVGDEFLVTIATRLKHCVRDSDTVARLGGDEFVLVLAGQNSQATIESTVQRVLAGVSQPWHVNGMDIQVTCSVGISLFPRDGVDATALLQHADAAMFEAKRLGRNHVRHFSRDLACAAVQRLELVSSLRRAIEQQALELHFQPKCDLLSGNVVGAEALLRWQHPEHGAISPSEFIPLAEEAGLIGRLGEWVLRTACQQNKQWQQAGYSPMPVSVNVSPLQLEQADFVAQVAAVLQDTGLAPGHLEIEITESGMMRNIERSMAILRELKQLGIRISVDDFGTGYSSLSYLRRLPLDTLKVDKSFIRDIATDPENSAIVRAVISLAASLKLNVVAEGVETEAEYRFLQDIGCDETQGYYKGRPVCADGFAARHLAAAGQAQAYLRQNAPVNSTSMENSSSRPSSMAAVQTQT